MNAPASSVALVERRWGAARLAALALGFVLPLAMVYANKSTPAILGVVLALSALAIALQHRGTLRGQLTSALRGILAPARLRSPLLTLSLLFCLWAALSITWSVDPRASVTAAVQALAPVLIAAGVIALFPRIATLEMLRYLAIGLVSAGLLILVDLGTDLAVRRLLGLRAETFALNRSVVTLTLLLWPLLAGLGASLRNVLAPALFCGMVIVAASSDSGTSVLAVAVAALAYAGALLMPRLAHRALLVGIVAAFALAPFAGQMLVASLTDAMHKAMASAHTLERIAIWRAFAGVVRERWDRGTGFASSAFVLRDPVAASVPKSLRADLGWGHPHNMFLQIWAELGAPGAFLACAALLVAARTWLKPGVRHGPFKTGFAACALSIAFVSHGAWQAWWLALLGACIAWFVVVERREHFNAY